jgi:hypothetical protein
VSIAPSRGADRSVRRSLAAIVAALVFVVLLAMPVAAVAGPTKLLDPAAGPAIGTTATTFRFEVTYRNREGSAPDHVRVVVDGVAHAMHSTSGGDDWKAGVRYSWSSRLAIGTHTVVFRAMDRERFTDQIQGGSVTVAGPSTPAPTPAPKPTPAPTPAPTPKPNPAPDPTPAPTEPGAPAPSDEPTRAGLGAGGSLDLFAGTARRPIGSANPDDPGTGNGPSAPGEPGASDPPGAGPAAGPVEPGAGPGQPGGGPDDPAAPGGGGGEGTGRGTDLRADWGELSHALSSLGLDPTAPVFGVVPVMITTSGAAAMAMAFLFFGKRRRDGEPPEPDEVLSAAAARGTGQAATSALVGTSVVPLGPMDPDALMPRWRRPSLLEARKADPLRNGAVIQNLTFERGVVGPVEGRERRIIRYHVVRLLDAPDELRGAEIGSLLHGDEVQLIERSGTYWMVLCPDGRQGWIHKMTLGDVVGETPAPTAQETWATASADADDVDDDVLTAFMAARGRA